MDYKKLAAAAVAAKEMSYSPYSKFKVGAALLTQSGKIYTGCNVESAAFGPTNCAERTAIFKAVSEGEQDFAAIAVAGSPEGKPPKECYPCGVCRQVMYEFVNKGEDIEIIIAKTADDYSTTTLRTLLPHGFGWEDMQ